MKSTAIILVFSGLFCIIAAVQSESDGVEIESEFGDEESTSEHLNRLKRNTDNFLKKYIDKLKNVIFLARFFLQNLKLKKCS